MTEKELYCYEDEECEDFVCVGEAVPAYSVQKYGAWIPLPMLTGKKQGEFTLDDYYALPDSVRAELIDGVLYNMSAPLSTHQMIQGELFIQIGNQIRSKKGKCIAMISPLDVQLNRDNKTMVQPDVVVMCRREKIRKKVIYGAPDFVAEVLSPGTRSKDMKIKLAKYRDAGVREYWILDPQKEQLLVYDFEKGDGPQCYGFSETVGLSIFQGEVKVDLRPVEEILEEFGEAD